MKGKVEKPRAPSAKLQAQVISEAALAVMRASEAMKTAGEAIARVSESCAKLAELSVDRVRGFGP